MSKIHILFVSSINDQAFRSKVDEYLKRISGYTSIQLETIKGEKILRGKENLVLQKEADRIRKKFKNGDYIITLADKGKKYNTPSFKSLLNKLLISQKRIVFVIGGPLGLDNELIKESHLVLSLSPMTLQHDIALIVTLEQIYRAFTIIHGEKYHK